MVAAIQGECIESPLSRDRDGYPRIKFNYRNMPASRMVYYILYGDIPEGKLVLHHCDNPACVNPEHLYLGDFTQNMQDKVDRGRVAGSRHPRSKLTDQQVYEIKFLYSDNGMSQAKIASMYGISQSQVSHIVLGKRLQTRNGNEIDNR